MKKKVPCLAQGAPMTLSLSLSDREWALFQAAAIQHKSTPAGLAKEVLSVWCADRRAERRAQADPGHYEARNGSDFEEVV